MPSQWHSIDNASARLDLQTIECDLAGTDEGMGASGVLVAASTPASVGGAATETARQDDGPHTWADITGSLPVAALA